MEGTMAEIRMFAGNFAPKSWGFCNGSLIQIASNSALFALLGTYYGGNGTTNFALPNLTSRIAVGAGQGPGLSQYIIGQTGGNESVTLTSAQLPAHVHPVTGTVLPGAYNSNGEDSSPVNQYAGVATSERYSGAGTAPMANANYSFTVGTAGSNQPMSIVEPVCGMNYIICMYGVFPTRS